MRKRFCDKCGKEIKGTEKRGKIRKKEIPILPWKVQITTRYWVGYRFEICNDCKRAILKSLTHKAESYDC